MPVIRYNLNNEAKESGPVKEMLPIELSEQKVRR